MIETLAQLRSLYAEPAERALRKQRPALDVHCQRFIALSPFCVVASAGAVAAHGGPGVGLLDASPRGGAPGFAKTPDAHTLLLGLLGMVCGFLAYWGTRLEQRVDELKARQCLLAEEMHKSYVPREDCRERTAQILGGLERADEKLDRIADAIRTGGR